MTMHERESVDFGPLRIGFDHRVLRPRSWTHAQSVWAQELLAELPDGPVLELCAGVGQIGLAAVAGSHRHLVAVDCSEVAVRYAEQNAVAAGLDDNVTVRHGTVEESLETSERFVLVIADPPWVPTDAVADHPQDPVLAIDGGTSGLVMARRCLDVARAHLAPGGVVLLQLGTAEQAHLLTADYAGAGLALHELRVFPGRGVLVRYGDRPSATGDTTVV